jgi:hypothetical protein
MVHILNNIAFHYHLSGLSPEGAKDLIQQPVVGYLEYDEYAVNKIRDLAADQPYIIHLICRVLVDYCNEKRKANATINDINIIIPTIMQTMQYHFEWIWDQCSPEIRVALSAFAEGGQEEGLPLSIDDVREIYRRYRIPDEPYLIRRSFQALIEEDIIATSSYAEEEHFWILSGLMRRWLLKEKSLNLTTQNEDL